MRAIHSKSQLVPKKSKAKEGCAVIIKFPHEQQASGLKKSINRGAPDPKLFKQFDLNHSGNVISINIHDIHDKNFANGFLLALSAAVKHFTSAKNEEKKLVFHFKGSNEAAAAVCLASMGLGSAEFCFSKTSEKTKFEKMRSDIDKQIKSIYKKAIPILKKNIQDFNNKHKAE